MYNTKKSEKTTKRSDKDNTASALKKKKQAQSTAHPSPEKGSE